MEGLVIRGVNQKEEIELPYLWTHPALIGNAPVVDWRVAAAEWPHLRDVAFPTHPRRRRVGILLGNRFPYLHQALAEVVSEKPDVESANRTPGAN